MLRPVEKLLGDIILVLADSREPEITTKAGLIAPAQAQDMDEALRHDHPRTGTVMQVGPGRKSKKGVRLPVDVAPGDRVLFTDWVGAPRPDQHIFATGEPNQIFMHAAEVLAVL